MDVTVIVGTFGPPEWSALAEERAIPSAEAQGAPVIHSHRLSLAQARNDGAAQADTDWLCFLDADDELAPSYFEAMSAASADLRAPAVTYITGTREAPPKLWPECDLRDGNYLLIGTLVRKAMFEAVGGFKTWPLYEDWCLWQRCWKAGASIEQVPDAIYRAHHRPKSRNRSPSRAEKLRWHHEIRAANFPELAEAAA